MEKIINNILCSGYSFDTKNTLTKLRFNIINALLSFLVIYTFVVAVSFTYLATEESVARHGMFNFLFSLAALFLIFYLRKDKSNYMNVVHILSFASIALLSSAYINIPEDKVRIMYFGFAVLAISLVGGKRYGQIFALAILSIVIGLHIFMNLEYTNLEIFTFSVSFIAIALLSTSFIGAFDTEAKELKKLNNILHELTVKDQLTDVYNRKGFDNFLNYHVDLFNRHGVLFGLIMVDIDNFKSINDQHGHSVGDEVLVKFAKLLEANTRNIDIISRWGGEEFAIICPKTDLADTLEIAEKLRLIICETQMSKFNGLSASFGVSIVTKNDNESSILNRADEALYEAKANGKNKVIKAA